MAMVKCPECRKEISDKAESCPNCGYVLVKNDLHRVRRTKIDYAAPDKKMGNILIWEGVLCIFGGIILIPIFFISIILWGLGITAISRGIKERTGKRKKADCPYCGNKIPISSYETTIKCPHCRKISTHKEDYLESIE